jgi:hypothetical protein
MKIMVFLHGTIIMHKNAVGKTRHEIIKQVIDQDKSVREFATYVPIGNAPKRLSEWVRQGAGICYLSALTEDKKARGDEVIGREGLKFDQMVLDRYKFPKGKVYHRQKGESYSDVIRRAGPGVLVEDDCESIGGEKEMAYPNLGTEMKKRIKSIVVKEFQGIDNLPSNPKELIE